MNQYSRSPYQRRLLRSPNGILLGVCEGIARRLGVPSFWVRLTTFTAFCCTGFFPVGLAYLILALCLPTGPDYY